MKSNWKAMGLIDCCIFTSFPEKNRKIENKLQLDLHSH